jgi:AraC-like DNA-binding protein
VRIKMASILLINLEEPVIEISMKVGYTTISSFNRHFKSIMSVAPKEWRKRNAV